MAPKKSAAVLSSQSQEELKPGARAMSDSKESEAEEAKPAEAKAESALVPDQVVPKPAEGMTWSDLEQHNPNKAYCSQCQRLVDAKVEKVVRKKGHAQLSCKDCHNVTSMLYKNFDMAVLGWQTLSSEDLQKFYQSAHMVKDEKGKFCLTKIKACVSETLSTITRTLTKRSASGAYMPLSVYEKQGYDTKPIAEKAEWMESALFGKVYRVQTISVDHSKIDEVVRERVQSAVRKVGANKKRPAPEADEQPDEDEASMASLESSDSDDEEKAKGNKGRKAGKAKKAKAKAHKLTEEEKQTKKENQTEIKKAKALEKLLAPLLPAAKKVLKLEHTPVTLQGLVAAGKESLKQAKKFIAAADKLSAKGKKCDAWEFDAKKCAKEMKKAIEEAEQLSKLVKDLGTDGLANLAKNAVEALTDAENSKDEDGEHE